MGKKYRQPTSVRDRRCEACGCFFTSQGLSGHRRYAHKEPGGNPGVEQLEKLRERRACAIAFAEVFGSKAIRPAEVESLMDLWELIVLRAHAFNIHPTEADFKNFILQKLTSGHMDWRMDQS